MQTFLLLVALVAARLGTWGSFVGTVKAEWLDDGRRMRLLDNFAYVDPARQTWNAPAGSEIDGASIPKVFWSFIGGPFEGKYRNASVVHDVACDQKSRPWRDVHRMFYNASRLGGVGSVSAKVMYFAVYHWGPRWGASRAARLVTSEDDFLRGRTYISEHPEITLDQIDELTSQFLQQRVPKVPPAVRLAPTDR